VFILAYLPVGHIAGFAAKKQKGKNAAKENNRRHDKADDQGFADAGFHASPPFAFTNEATASASVIAASRETL
jgi:hypothetical protein